MGRGRAWLLLLCNASLATYSTAETPYVYTEQLLPAENQPILSQSPPFQYATLRFRPEPNDNDFEAYRSQANNSPQTLSLDSYPFTPEEAYSGQAQYDPTMKEPTDSVPTSVLEENNSALYSTGNPITYQTPNLLPMYQYMQFRYAPLSNYFKDSFKIVVPDIRTDSPDKPIAVVPFKPPKRKPNKVSSQPPASPPRPEAPSAPSVPYTAPSTQYAAPSEPHPAPYAAPSEPHPAPYAAPSEPHPAPYAAPSEPHPAPYAAPSEPHPAPYAAPSEPHPAPYSAPSEPHPAPYAAPSEPHPAPYSAPSEPHPAPYAAPSEPHPAPYAAPSEPHPAPYAAPSEPHPAPYAAPSEPHPAPYAAPSEPHPAPYSAPSAPYAPPSAPYAATLASEPSALYSSPGRATGDGPYAPAYSSYHSDRLGSEGDFRSGIFLGNRDIPKPSFIFMWVRGRGLFDVDGGGPLRLGSGSYSYLSPENVPVYMLDVSR